MRRTRPLAATLCGLTVAAAVAIVVLAIVDPNVSGPEHVSATGPTPHDKRSGGFLPYAFLTGVVFSTFAAVGATVAVRRPRNPVGWFVGLGAFLWCLAALSSEVYWHMAFGRVDAPSASNYVAWFGSWAFLPAFVFLLSLVPLLFPTGTPPGPRWRVVGWAAAGVGAVAIVSTGLEPGPMSSADFGWIDNPFGVDGLGLRTVADVSFVGVALAALAGLVSLVVRYRRAQGIERLQLRWVALAGCLLVAFAVGGDVASSLLGSGAGWVGILLGLLCIAVAVGVAMLRYRLYDLDVVVNRALVYTALTVTLAAAYLACVLLLQIVLSPSSDFAIAVSTLAAAALVRPARARIQRAVDRRFYRRKYDTARTLERFGVRLRDELDIDALGAELRSVVAETMQPAHVSLWIREAGR